MLQPPWLAGMSSQGFCCTLALIGQHTLQSISTYTVEAEYLLI